MLAKDKMLNNKGIYQRYEIEWIGREGLAPETHDAYLKEFINHFYKNTLKLIDRAMRKEDNSPQVNAELSLFNNLNTLLSLARGKLSQSCCNICLHACKNNCDVFYGRKEELERIKVHRNPLWI